MKSGISRLRRLGIGALAGLTMAVGMATLAVPADAAAGFSFRRYAGANRFDTARLIAIDTFGTSDTVLLARGDLFPDALAGNYLAGSTGAGAPILLTRVESLPSETDEAIRTLGATRVIILGGPNAVSTAVEAQLRSRNLTVERTAGADRFETAQRVAERPGAGNVGSVDGLKTAILASGRNFPDALAGGPLSYASKFPTLITEPSFLSPQARSAFTNLAIKQVLLLGGTSAVATQVEDEVRAMGITVVRLQGANRRETANKIADFALSKLGFSTTHMNLARGDGFADALSGGPHGGKEKSYILLTESPTSLGNETRDYITSKSSTLTSGHIFGGTAAVSNEVEQDATRAGLSGRATVTVSPTSVPQGGTVRGTISAQNLRSLTVSGCGLSNQAVTTDANGAFSFVLPQSQPAGQCTLTFTETFTDGTTETDTVVMTITTGASIARTQAPELVSASVVRTFSQPDPASGVPYEQTVVRYTFDGVVTGQALRSYGIEAVGSRCTVNDRGCSLKFVLYKFDRLAVPASFLGQAAQVDPNDSNSVLVTFGESPGTAPQPNGTGTGPVGPRQINEVTLAAVAFDAVRDNGGRFNPEGDAPLSTVTFAAGRTSAPDLVTAGNFRPNFDSTRTLVDFTFDQPAFVPTVGPGTATADPNNPARRTTANDAPLAGEGYRLIVNDSDGTVRTCTFQPSATGSTTNGNGTTVHTVACNLVAGAQITASNVARAVVQAFTVAAASATGATTASTTTFNPLQAADITAQGDTTRPDLVSATFQPEASASPTAATPTAVDRVTFTFDEPVLPPVAEDANTQCAGAPAFTPTPTPGTGNDAQSRGGCFVVYRSDGREVFGDQIVDAAPFRSSTNSSEIVVTFPDGTLNDAVGASVRENAVFEAVGTGGVNRSNREDEVDVAPTSFSGGRTTGPDLVGCRADPTQRDPVTGSAENFQIVFVFDEIVDAAITSSRFSVYNFNGAEVTPATATATRRSPSTTEVVLTDPLLTRDVILSIATCGIEENAVRDVPAQGSAASNPIGYEGLVRGS